MIKLEYYRTNAGLSQLELAKKVGLTQQRISAYELGKREPDLETLKLLADFFGITTDELLGIKNETDNIQVAFSSGFAGLNEENKKLALDIIASIKAKQDLQKD